MGCLSDGWLLLMFNEGYPSTGLEAQSNSAFSCNGVGLEIALLHFWGMWQYFLRLHNWYVILLPVLLKVCPDLKYLHEFCSEFN
jgi:hypothetical protein